MQCARCGEENDDKRAACWYCFAPLHLPADAKIRRIEPKKVERAEAVQPKPVAVPVTEPVQEVQPAPVPEPEPEQELQPEPVSEPEPALEPEPEPAPEPAVAAAEPAADLIQQEEAEEELPAAAGRPVLDLDESAAEEPVPETGYVVPGLAEPEPEAEKETPAPEPPARPVFDFDALEEETPEPPEEPKPEDKA